METSELLKKARLIPHPGGHLIDTQTVLSLMEEFAASQEEIGSTIYDTAWDDGIAATIDMVRMCFKSMAENSQFEVSAATSEPNNKGYDSTHD